MVKERFKARVFVGIRGVALESIDSQIVLNDIDSNTFRDWFDFISYLETHDPNPSFDAGRYAVTGLVEADDDSVEYSDLSIITIV